ncbi:MAG: DUF4345 family protein [Pseudomonadota bacterium]
MTAYLNPALALLSIALGLIGWISPSYVMETLRLSPLEGTNMGMSEIRAASGALFVGLGVGALVISTPQAYLMMGIAWTFAALGRGTSLIFDGTSELKWVFFVVEIAVGLALIWKNRDAFERVATL